MPPRWGHFCAGLHSYAHAILAPREMRYYTSRTFSMYRTQTRGFTLIELLVVIAIIGILSSVVLASLNSARKKGRDARRISDIKQLQLALELYNDTNQGFPTAAEACPAIPENPVLVTNNYISSLPQDPTLLTNYEYSALDEDGVTACTTAPCSSYVIGATIEGGVAAVPLGDIDTNYTSPSPAINCADPLFCVTP